MKRAETYIKDFFSVGGGMEKWEEEHWKNAH